MFAQPQNPYLADKHRTARQLRYLGATVNRIASYLGVSKSSVSVWTRDIELLPRHREANFRSARASSGVACSERSRSKRLTYQSEGRERARQGEPLHSAGCMLYWAEGSKERNCVLFANSDPAMMGMFVEFLRECFGLTADDLTFRINAYTNNGRSIEEIERYWIELLDLNPACARKHVVNHFPTSSSGKRRNKLPNGVCTLRVKRSTWLVQHIYGAIQEYSGIDQPQWLDGPVPVRT